MKILIAGLGSIGRRHLRNLKALGVEELFLYRTHQSTLPDEDLAPYPVFNTLQKALDQKPAAVVISNPTSLHLDVAVPAARSGCHLFLEKPISHSLDGIDTLQTVVEIAGIQVMGGYQFRFHPGLNIVHKLLVDKAIGKPISVQAHWGEYLPGWHPWEDFRKAYAARADLGGGVIRPLCHPLDYLRWLMGDVRSVAAVTSAQGLVLDVEDTAEINLRFVNEITGSVHLDYIQRPSQHTLRIIGSQGTIFWDNADGAVKVYQPETQPEAKIYPVPNGFERNSMFLSQMEHFLAVVRGEQNPLCTLEDGIQALRFIQACYQSSNSGQFVEI